MRENQEASAELVLARLPGIETVLARQICALMQRIRRLNFYKRPGIAETLDWASALLALNRRALDQAAVEETLGCIFKYKEDIERMHGEMANKTLDLDLVVKESADDPGVERTMQITDVLGFSRSLKDAGIRIRLGQVIDASRSLEFVDIGCRSDFYSALRANPHFSQRRNGELATPVR